MNKWWFASLRSLLEGEPSFTPANSQFSLKSVLRNQHNFDNSYPYNHNSQTIRIKKDKIINKLWINLQANYTKEKTLELHTTHYYIKPMLLLLLEQDIFYNFWKLYKNEILGGKFLILESSKFYKNGHFKMQIISFLINQK